jgi:mono/diheme cytochrome c family protein
MRYFLALFILATVGIVMVAGFRGDKSRRTPIEIIPDMDRQPKLRPQTDTTFFGWENGMSSRKPVEGTVARGSTFIEDEFSTGMQPGTTNFVQLSPVKISERLMDRGQQQFNIYCLPCHGQVGDGKGITTRLGMAPVANLHDARIVLMPDGEIFNTITHGKNLMGAYGSNIDVEDRWAVVAYVRAIQRSQLATIEDVPEFARQNLK